MLELDLDKVMELFSLFSDLEGCELERWRGFCRVEADSLGERVREDVDASACMEQLCTAAAGLAYSDYLTLQTASGPGDEVRVGDISLRSSAASRQESGAGEIREHFLRGVARLLRPEYAALIAAGGKG